MNPGDTFGSDGISQGQVCFEAWGSGQRGSQEGAVGPKMPCYGERRRGMSQERGRKPFEKASGTLKKGSDNSSNNTIIAIG